MLVSLDDRQTYRQTDCSWNRLCECFHRVQGRGGSRGGGGGGGATGPPLSSSDHVPYLHEYPTYTPSILELVVLLVHLELAVQCTKVPREPILTTEK